MVVQTGCDGEGRDSIYSLSIVDKENTDNYCFHMEAEQEDPLMKGWLLAKDHTVISDRDKGLKKALGMCLATAFILNCALHLLNNVPGEKINPRHSRHLKKNQRLVRDTITFLMGAVLSHWKETVSQYSK